MGWVWEYLCCMWMLTTGSMMTQPVGIHQPLSLDIPVLVRWANEWNCYSRRDGCYLGFDVDLSSHRLTWLPTLLSAQFLNSRNPNMSPFPRRPTSPWITEGLQWTFSIRDWASICLYGNNHIFWNGFASPSAFTRAIILGFSNYFIHFVHLWIILYNISSGRETHFTVKEVR